MEADLIGLIWYIVKSICLEEVSFKSPRKKSGLVHKREREGEGGRRRCHSNKNFWKPFIASHRFFLKSELNESFPCNV